MQTTGKDNNEIEKYIQVWFNNNRPDISLDQEFLEIIYKQIEEDIPSTPYSYDLESAKILINQFLSLHFGDSIFTKIKTIFENQFEDDYNKFLEMGVLNEEIKIIMLNLAKEDVISDNVTISGDDIVLNDEEIEKNIYKEIKDYLKENW